MPFYFAIQFSAHLSSSSTLTGFLPSSQQRDWQSWEGLWRPNFLQSRRQRGKPGADSGQTHTQVLVCSLAWEGGTSQSWAAWAGQDALCGFCPLHILRVFPQSWHKTGNSVAVPPQSSSLDTGDHAFCCDFADHTGQPDNKAPWDPSNFPSTKGVHPVLTGSGPSSLSTGSHMGCGIQGAGVRCKMQDTG